MALIKCPECKRTVSTKAHTCPKCGFIVENYTPSQEEIENFQQRTRKRKKRIKKSLILFCAIILSIVIIGCGFGIYSEYSYILEKKKAEAEAKNKYPLFTTSTVLSVDPYGLSNENNIFGKSISTILKGYVEGKDYSVKKEKDCTTYTFSSIDANYPLGSGNADMIIYATDGTITKLEYTFRLLKNESTRMRIYEWRARSSLTSYYDVDPIYTGYNYDNDKYVIMSKSEFEDLSHNYDVCFISWQSEKGNAMYSHTNMFDEKDEYGTMTFTNNETAIKKEEFVQKIPTI